MIPDKMWQVLKSESVASIVTMGDDSPHVVNTWNSSLYVTQDEHLLSPVGGMVRTEGNWAANISILITLGSQDVAGPHGPGAGFLIKGTAPVLKSGKPFDIVKKRFSWARAAMEITILSVAQTL